MRWQIVAFALGVTCFAALLYGAYMRGQDAAKLDLLKARLEAERARQEVDDAVKSLSDRDLCIRLGGLPDDCNKL
jgi:hypothetical protein